MKKQPWLNWLKTLPKNNANGKAVTAEQLNNIRGVSGAIAANEAEYLAAFQATTPSPFVDPENPTPEEIQKVIDAVNTIVANEKAALAELVEDITRNNANGKAVTAEQLNNIRGVSGAIAENEAEYLKAFQATTPSPFADPENPTPAEIQEVIDAVNTIVANEKAALAELVEDVTKNNANGKAVTAEQLNNIRGVSGATAENQAEYLKAFQEKQPSPFADLENPTPTEIQKVIDTVNALQKIEHFAAANGDTNIAPAPTLDDYADADVTGVTADNRDEVNADIAALEASDVDTQTEVQDVVNAVIAGNKIEAYADDQTKPEPELSDFIDLGVTGVTAENKDEVNAAIAALTPAGVDSKDKVQDVVDAVIAGNKIEAYADDQVNNVPTKSDYDDLGITGVTDGADGNLDEVNEAIAALNPEDVDSKDKVQKVVDAVNAGKKIEAYADDQTKPVPELSDYSDLGVTGVTDGANGNLDEVNAAIAALNSEDVDTKDEVQDVVDAVNAGNKIEAYAGDQTKPAPELNDYTDLGVTGVTAENKDEVNAAIAALNPEDVDSKDKVQKVVNAIIAGNKIEAYADDQANDVPTKSDYDDLGITGVTDGADGNLDEVNEAIAALNPTDVDSKDKVQGVVDAVNAGNKIEAYADDQTKPAPELSDFTDLGVTGVTAENKDEVNAVIAALNPEDVDSKDKVQKVVNAIIAGNKIEAYADDQVNDVPAKSDYDDLGITGVTDGADGNLDEVNEAIAALNPADVDSKDKVQDVVDAG